MARRRANMREGPLAELFRATSGADSGDREKAKAAEVDEPTRDDAQPTRDAEAAELQTIEESPSRAEASAAEATEGLDETEESASPLSSVAEPGEEPGPTRRPAAEFDRPRLDTRLDTNLLRAPRSDTSAYFAVIRVVGVGGAGLNAVDRMIESGLSQVEFVGVNTDVQQLRACEAPVKLHIGRDLTEGLGSGSDPEVGRVVAEEARDQIKHVLRGSDMVFVTAGEGGGTGTGAAPVIARIAREVDALTVGIVTMPFRFEGTRRRSQAAAGVEELRAVCDTLIIIPNDRLLEVLDRSTSMVDAFGVADDVLRQGVQGICDLITMPGLINLDFADVRTVMRDAGSALMGIGYATGEGRAAQAAQRALSSPLIDTEITGATGILLSIAGGDDLTLLEVNEAAEVIRAAAATETNTIFGATVDPDLTGQIWVTVVATGLGSGPPRPRVERGDALDPPAFLRDL